jgi:hypothetical protein
MGKRKVQKFFFLSQSQKTAELVEGTEAFFNRRPDPTNRNHWTAIPLPPLPSMASSPYAGPQVAGSIPRHISGIARRHSLPKEVQIPYFYLT